MLQFMESQRVRHVLTTQKQQKSCEYVNPKLWIYSSPPHFPSGKCKLVFKVHESVSVLLFFFFFFFIISSFTSFIFFFKITWWINVFFYNFLEFFSFSNIYQIFMYLILLLISKWPTHFLLRGWRPQ